MSFIVGFVIFVIVVGGLLIVYDLRATGGTAMPKQDQPTAEVSSQVPASAGPQGTDRPVLAAPAEAVDEDASGSRGSQAAVSVEAAAGEETDVQGPAG